MKLNSFITIVLFILQGECHLFPQSWKWQNEEGKHIDLLYAEKKIARYVYEKMDPNDRERTYKPFHHIYQSNGSDFLTKGPGGKFTHHRGIYFGFSKCTAFDRGENQVIVDTWHCKRGYQTHEKVINQKAGRDTASQTVKIAWRVDDGTIFATEHRTLSFSILEDDSVQIDFKSKLSTDQKLVKFDGDPQHAGFQFRASNEVAESNSKQTYYIRPVDGKDVKGKTKNWPKDTDMTNLLWKAQSVVVGGNRYTTVYLDHPGNPKPSFFSERDYGRFGSYFKSEITPSKPLLVKYRLNISLKERSIKDCKHLSSLFVKTF
tara:strand:- start:385 stop:1338 length:954 start_codon:yes stop_codon:yes gene_type:complete